MPRLRSWTALLNGANQRSLLQTQQFVTPPSAGIFIATVHAQEIERSRQFVIPEETQGEQIWRGLTGSRADRVWFVIADREQTKDAAEKEAACINQSSKGFRAEAYEPYKGRGSWSVVIGDWLVHPGNQPDDGSRRTRVARRREALAARFMGTAVETAPSSGVALDAPRVATCLRALPERDRLVVLLTFYADREAPRIAADLGVSPGAVRTIRHRAMARLRECVLGGPRP